MFFALIPLLFVFQNTTFHYKQLFNFTFITFLIFHMGTVWWLSISSFFGFIAIILSNSVVMAFVWVIAYRIRQKTGFALGLISIVTLWLTFEYIHYNWELSWPFMNFGNWLGQVPKWIQWYEYTGVLGGTFWLLLVNVVLFLAVNCFINKKKARSAIAGITGALIFIIPILVSHHIYKNYKETGMEIIFLIIQPDIDPYTEKYNTSLFQKQIREQIKQAKEALTDKIDCCIFPESSFPLYLDENKINSDSFFQEIDNALRNLY